MDPACERDDLALGDAELMKSAGRSATCRR